MKRVLLGIVWFVLSYFILLLLCSIILMLFIAPSLPQGVNAQQGIDAVNAYKAEHPLLMAGISWGVLVGAVLVAILGTLKGLLPGTRKKPAA